jgi:pilus assembly protein Flp/PilA
VKNLFVHFVKDDSGATAIDLGLIAAGISLSIIVIMISLIINR